MWLDPPAPGQLCVVGADNVVDEDEAPALVLELPILAAVPLPDDADLFLDGSSAALISSTIFSGIQGRVKR
jgi:hypothetical protein